MEVDVICTVCLVKGFFPTRTKSFSVVIIVQLASERSSLKEQIQKQAALVKSLEAYFSLDIKYVGVITKVSIQKIDPEMLRTVGIQ